MSRRRQAPQDDGRGWVDIAIVCTGRGRHARHRFGRVTVHPEHGMIENAGSEVITADPAGSKWDRGETPTLEDMAAMHQTHRFQCPRCPGRGGDYRITRDKLERIAQALADRDTRPVLDLSAAWAATISE